MSAALNQEQDFALPEMSASNGVTKRSKRSEADMLRSLKGPVAEAHYVIERIMKLESKIGELLGGISAEARALIVKQYEHLGRY